MIVLKLRELEEDSNWVSIGEMKITDNTIFPDSKSFMFQITERHGISINFLDKEIKLLAKEI
jgi:hypothetical protein